MDSDIQGCMGTISVIIIWNLLLLRDLFTVFFVGWVENVPDFGCNRVESFKFVAFTDQLFVGIIVKSIIYSIMQIRYSFVYFCHILYVAGSLNLDGFGERYLKNLSDNLCET